MPVTSKVALVIDALPGLGGAERVLMAAMDLFPQASIYTLVYQRQAFINTALAQRRVFTSYLDRLPAAQTQYRKYLPLMPHAIQQFNFMDYNLVISFSYAVAHGITTGPGQMHLSYTYTPMRYAWRNFSVNGIKNPHDKLLSYLLQPFRNWDKKVVSHIGRMASVSQWVNDLVQHIYHRDSTVIYPPVEVERFSPQAQRENYYMTVSRLVRHKRVDLTVEAFNHLKLPLLIIGDGPQRSRLERRALANIRFLGFQSDESIASLLGQARGYLCASEEDFGISMVEAQAAGCPVIAFGQGGALEIIQDGQTGILFHEQTPDQLVDAILQNEAQIKRFNPLTITENARRFNKGRFLEEFSLFVEGETE